MDFKLRYEKDTVSELYVTHLPCEWCSRDSSTKKEVEKMLASLTLTNQLDKDLAWMYHFLAHTTTIQGRSFLLWVDSDKLVWLYQVAQCMDDDHSHGSRIKKMVADVMTEREKINNAIIRSQTIIEEERSGPSVDSTAGATPPRAKYSRQEYSDDDE